MLNIYGPLVAEQVVSLVSPALQEEQMALLNICFLEKQNRLVSISLCHDWPLPITSVPCPLSLWAELLGPRAHTMGCCFCLRCCFCLPSIHVPSFGINTLTSFGDPSIPEVGPCLRFGRIPFHPPSLANQIISFPLHRWLAQGWALDLKG